VFVLNVWALALYVVLYCFRKLFVGDSYIPLALVLELQGSLRLGAVVEVDRVGDFLTFRSCFYNTVEVTNVERA
jgi:hypothetical protein